MNRAKRAPRAAVLRTCDGCLEIVHDNPRRSRDLHVLVRTTRNAGRGFGYANVTVRMTDAGVSPDRRRRYRVVWSSKVSTRGSDETSVSPALSAALSAGWSVVADHASLSAGLIVAHLPSHSAAREAAAGAIVKSGGAGYAVGPRGGAR